MTAATSTSPVQRPRTLAEDLIRPQAKDVDRTVAPRALPDDGGSAGLLAPADRGATLQLFWDVG